MLDTQKEGDNVVSLVELKRLKNQRRRHRKKMTFAELKAGQRKERSKVSKPSIREWWLILSKCIAAFSIFLFFSSEAGMGIAVGYMQNNSDIPQWISQVNAWYCATIWMRTARQSG